MTTTITTARQGAAALALASIALQGLAWALRSILAPALALLLTACSYQPARPARSPQAPPKQLKPAATHDKPFEGRPVRELRCIARSRGIPSRLWKSARKEQLVTLLSTCSG